ncbi:PREDICTED: disrupted in schizophrenia 1 protein isoform X1 [Poecilia mexicana]|uniref:disrupted in schizophrenia 1 protein isoform X1 n=1 Tax=Poecilia mexicana TaxID=48701 RepID=UPI00072ED3FD|nr:PREDICTED: disrupted in schizophrenia 1 protein isoform X1 [Poecilia mexicana]XP_014852610.1 PREDICTED: disrupted in schizophrenia 1 protein isoform X1 [Poecilia mexicana]
MFAGLMGLDCHLNSLHHRCESTEAASRDAVFNLRASSSSKGGKVSGTAGSSGRKRLHRRPGYMRGEQARLQCTAHAQDEEEDEEEEESIACIRNGRSGCHADLTKATRVQQLSQAPTVKVSLTNELHHKPSTCSSSESKNLAGPLNGVQTTSNELSPSLQSSSEVVFSSSFSFIQQSLNSNQRTDSARPSQEPEPTNQPANLEKKREEIITKSSQVHKEERSYGGRCWRDCLWTGKEEMSHLPNSESQSLDIEVTSSLSVDSDTASASSVTSGYESATPASEQGWDSLVKTYDGVLQDCLQNNRTYTKIESMMLKLQRLQQKAILDDDYDAAERFGKKLEELCGERGALKLGLPSMQPSVAHFLERLSKVVHSALQREDCGHRREGSEPDSVEQSDPTQRRDRLIQEKHQVEEEIEKLQTRLAQLKDRSRYLEQLIQQEEQRAEAAELEGSVVRSCTVAQLRDMSRTLQDLISSENRTQISVSPPPSTLRLQEQEQALNLSMKEATAKVVMSQRLGSSLRRKVSETETQLLALHEAKLAAISGNDFGCAKELKAEMKAVYLERDRLEALARRLHSLSSGSSQELARMKEQRQQLRLELEHREALHESRLKENATKYVELLEDRLQSCGCPGLERIWEADLEACHLFLRGLHLRTSSCSGPDVDDTPDPVVYTSTHPSTKEEEDCAMLTALGGRWCPEANLQNSEFTKKLEEFLFCMEENHPEDACSEADAADLTERCELISDRLIALEDKLQTAILNRDQALTQCLEKEVQEVKSTLQRMLTQLQVEEQQEDDTDVSDELVKDETRVKVKAEEEDDEEEEEDQYFSDSWDI